jgi:cyclohexanecarboxyl-CoA dehydrogenase
MDFQVSDETAMLLDVARAAAKELSVGYQARDRGESPVDEVFEILGRAHLLGLNAPVEASGQGTETLPTGMVCEIVGAADWAAGGLVGGSSTWLKLIHTYGDPRLHGWLPELAAGRRRLAFSVTEQQSGSDMRHIRTRARLDGDSWVITGEKTSTSWPSADAALVLARDENEEDALFLVPLDSPGITVSELLDLGNRAIGRSIVSYTDVRVPDYHRLGEVGQGVRRLMANFSIQKVYLGLMAIGSAEAAVNDAIEWAKQRVTFGQPLSHRQGITFPITRALADIEMARLLCYKALWKCDNAQSYWREAAMVKAFVPRRMVEIIHDAMLVLGHGGYSSEHVIGLRLRDVIATEFAEGPENVQMNLISRDVFGERPS